MTTEDFDLYKTLVRFGCNETCFEKCKNNSQVQYYNGTNERNAWFTGSDIQFRCKTGYKKIIDIFFCIYNQENRFFLTLHQIRMYHTYMFPDDNQNVGYDVIFFDIYGLIVDNKIMSAIIGSTVVAVLVGITICCVLRRRYNRKSTKLQGN